MSTTTANEFSKLESFNPAIKFSDLKFNTRYLITRASRVTTKYGEHIVCTLVVREEDCDIFLPSRFSAMSNELLEDLNSGRMVLIVLNQVGRTWRLKLDTCNDQDLPSTQI